MKIKSYIAMLCLCCLLIPYAAFAAGTSAAAPQRKVRTIWDYSSQLGLTKDQQAGLKKAVSDFQTQLTTLRGQLRDNEAAVQESISKGSDIDSIKTQMEKSAGIQVQMRLADIETARKIESVLTPDQLKKWHDIQRKARASAKS